MADGLLVGAVVGAVFGELLKVVIDAGKKMAMFKSELERIESFLVSIKPIIEEIEKSNGLLGRPEEETTMFVDRLRDARRLVLKCSIINTKNLYKRIKYTNKLVKLEESLLRFFQMDVQGQLVCDSKKTLVKLRDNSYKLDQMLFILKNGGGFAGSCGVPGLRDHIIGLDKPLRELKEMVLKDDVSAVLISAQGGSGKTTLAEKLCHDDDIKGKFKDIFFATVSKTANLMGIVSKLFEHKGIQLRNEFKTDEDAFRQLEQLMMRLIRDIGPVLLVLDDVWSEWEFLLENFRFSIHGYKLLVTSRFVFRRFDCIYKLNILNDEDATNLFRNSAFHQDGNSNIPDDLVKKIVKGCKGSPLALTVVGRSLYGQHTVKWRSLLKKWSEGNSFFDSNKDDVLYCFQTSLDDLDKSPTVRECFLDVALFPEDQKIRATTLMDMWVELYNLDDEGTFENLLELSFRNLINLVPTRIEALEVEGNCNEHFVTQHDLLRELAIHQNKEEPTEQRRRLMVETIGNDFPEWWVKQRDQTIHARLLSISTDRKFSSSWYDMQLSEVEVLIVNIHQDSNTLTGDETLSLSSSDTQLSEAEVPPDTQYPVLEYPIMGSRFFYSGIFDIWQPRRYTLPNFMDSMYQLKVLIVKYYDTYISKVNFPPGVYLSSLRRMRLENVSISSLSTSLLQMRNLQKMALIGCYIGTAFENCTTEMSHKLSNLLEIEIEQSRDFEKLPAEIFNIVSLKKISITYCNLFFYLPGEIERLTNLEVLRLRACLALPALPESVGSLHKLKYLDISFCKVLRKMPQRMGELRGLGTLDMRGCPRLQVLPPSIERLQHLKYVACDEEIAHLWKFNKGHLANLKINGVSRKIIQDQMSFVENSFPCFNACVIM